MAAPEPAAPAVPSAISTQSVRSANLAQFKWVPVRNAADMREEGNAAGCCPISPAPHTAWMCRRPNCAAGIAPCCAPVEAEVARRLGGRLILRQHLPLVLHFLGFICATVLPRLAIGGSGGGGGGGGRAHLERPWHAGGRAAAVGVTDCDARLLKALARRAAAPLNLSKVALAQLGFTRPRVGCDRATRRYRIASGVSQALR